MMYLDFGVDSKNLGKVILEGKQMFEMLNFNTLVRRKTSDLFI